MDSVIASLSSVGIFEVRPGTPRVTVNADGDFEVELLPAEQSIRPGLIVREFRPIRRD
jgi:hypothetical protein